MDISKFSKETIDTNESACILSVTRAFESQRQKMFDGADASFPPRTGSAGFSSSLFRPWRQCKYSLEPSETRLKSSGGALYSLLSAASAIKLHNS